MIRAVLFDLGNVLVPFRLDRGYQAFSNLTGLDPALVAERLTSSSLYRDYELGTIDTDEFRENMSKLLQFDVGLAELRAAWNHIFLPEPSTSEALLLELKARFRLVLLSNTNELHFNWLWERYPLLRHFDDYCLSYQAKAMKPDPRIFSDAVQRAGCLPEECFYTDDIVPYVEAAREFGIDAEVFTGEEPLRVQLRTRGLIA